MRRPFLRTSGSPQAPATVETPAHYAPTLFCRLAPLSEVVIGSVEPLNLAKDGMMPLCVAKMLKKSSIIATFGAT